MLIVTLSCSTQRQFKPDAGYFHSLLPMNLTRAVNISFVAIFLLRQIQVAFLDSRSSRWLREGNTVQGAQEKIGPSTRTNVNYPLGIRRHSPSERRLRVNTSTPPLSDHFEDGQLSPSNRTRELLDFVVGGFPHCGTSSLRRWIESLSQTSLSEQLPHQEQFYARPIQHIVKSLHRTMPANSDFGSRILHGIWSPNFVRSKRFVVNLTSK